MQCRLCFFQREFLSIRCDAVHFEYNEAVIKMIIKGRRPTMRHVSRSHRVALDLLLVDRNNLDLKIQIKYVDTNNQQADMLTKRNFTRDEWNHLLRLLNIMNFPMFSCSHFPSMKKDEHHVDESSGKKDKRRAGARINVGIG